MPLKVELEPWSSPEPETPPEFSPPPLSQLDTVLAQRRRFVEQRGGRPALVDLLLAEHRAQGAPAASLRNVERLARDDCFAIVTGQQPGLLTGPLYTPWKILSAILLARRLERERPETFVPVFWNAGEDHDTAEMDHFYWLDREGRLVRFQLDLPSSGEPDSPPISFGGRPAKSLDIESLLAFWDEMLFETEFSAPLKATVFEAWQSADTLGEFCNQLLWRLFPDSGLVIVTSSYRSYPHLVNDLLRAEIEEPLRSNTLINEAGQQLRARNFRPRMHRPGGRCSFFLYEGDARLPLQFDEGNFVALGKTYAPGALLARLEERPEDFSAAANLRPVLQDALLPTAVNILGPGELAYHLQLKSLYALHQVLQPVAVQRLSLSLLPPRVSRGLNKLGLGAADLQRPLAQLSGQVASRQALPRLEPLCEELKAQIRHTLGLLRHDAASLDKALEAGVIGQEKQLLAQVEKLQKRLAAQLRRRDSHTRQTVARLQAALWPDGQPQERALNLFYFLNLFGPALLPALAERLKDGDLPGGWLVRLHYGR